MDRELLNVILGFAAIAAVAIPICLKIDKHRKRKAKEHFDKLFRGEIETPCIQEVKDRSGVIELIDGVVKHQLKNYGMWKLPVSEIKVIGEYTNQNGPFADDYFFVFVTATTWHEASFYAHGCDTFLKKLGTALNQEIDCTLFASADFNSNILWPPSISGEEMFEFRREGWKGKLGLENKQYFTQKLIDFVKQ